ncbi:MAG: hypothetical protein ACI9TH_000499 [Kiritimatiellia bacterium]|jgi:hypothetical protein
MLMIRNNIPPLFRQTLRRMLIGASLLTILCSCTPVTEREQEYLDSQKEEKEKEDAFGKKLDAGAEQAEMIKKVQEKERPDGLTNEEWLNRHMAGEARVGTIPVDDWVATELSANNFEVRYTYTLLNRNYEPTKKGMAWKIDSVLERVIGPRILTPEELGGRGKRVGKMQSERWEKKDRDNLE